MTLPLTPIGSVIPVGKEKRSICFTVDGLGVLLFMKKGGPAGPEVGRELNPVFNSFFISCGTAGNRSVGLMVVEQQRIGRIDVRRTLGSDCFSSLVHVP